MCPPMRKHLEFQPIRSCHIFCQPMKSHFKFQPIRSCHVFVSANYESLWISTNQKLPCFQHAPNKNVCICKLKQHTTIISRLMSSKGIISSKLNDKMLTLGCPKILTGFSFAPLYNSTSFCLGPLRWYTTYCDCLEYLCLLQLYFTLSYFSA